MTSISISDASKTLLQAIADKEGVSLQAILERAIEAYRRQWLLEETNVAFASLRRNPEAWAEELEERRAWESTLAEDRKMLHDATFARRYLARGFKSNPWA